ncbi:MAG: hypothetical protein DI541_12140 [Aeromonas media]|nr:MAG: hypothetical protein DI541_12140 [Aeromonas media]
MNEQDILLYHFMLNIELKLFTNNLYSLVKDDDSFTRFVVKEFKRLKRNKKITLSIFKSFYETFRPNSQGFKLRWNKKLSRYREIYEKNDILQQKNKAERLNLFMLELARYNFVIKLGHEDEIEFTPSESDNILSVGFVGFHKDELAKIESKFNDVVLTYYIGECGIKGETILIYHLQNFGFNIALDLQRAQDRLAHQLFSSVSIESFHERLSFSGDVNREN